MFKKIAIIGLGLIGGSLAAACKRKKVRAQIIGVDEKDVVEIAREQRLIDEGIIHTEFEKTTLDADLVILATPVSVILELIEMMPNLVKPGALITDVGSTKAEIIKKADQFLPGDIYFLGGHPMAGSEKGGLMNADPLLFETAVYVLTKSQKVPDDLVNAFSELISLVGARVLFLDPETHDKILAVVSHLPHVIAVALMSYAAKLNQEDENYLKLAAGGFRDLTRIASSPYTMWRDIYATNHHYIMEAIDDFESELKKFKGSLTEEKLESLITETAQRRNTIPKDARGFLHPFFEVSVIIEDKPGVIAKISTMLARENINIKDIEILKVREGEAGNLRLAFESEPVRERALWLFKENGFQASKR